MLPGPSVSKIAKKEESPKGFLFHFLKEVTTLYNKDFGRYSDPNQRQENDEYDEPYDQEHTSHGNLDSEVRKSPQILGELRFNPVSVISR